MMSENSSCMLLRYPLHIKVCLQGQVLVIQEVTPSWAVL